VGRIPHLPPHLRVPPVRARGERGEVQRWLGHHSPAFTLATYVHLLDEGVGEALDLSAELAGVGEGAKPVEEAVLTLA